MKSMGDPDYVYRPHTAEQNAKRSEIMKKIIAERRADGRGWGWAGKVWTTEETELLNYLHHEGMDYYEIAQALERGANATDKQLQNTNSTYAKRRRLRIAAGKSRTSEL